MLPSREAVQRTVASLLLGSFDATLACRTQVLTEEREEVLLVLRRHGGVQILVSRTGYHPKGLRLRCRAEQPAAFGERRPRVVSARDHQERHAQFADTRDRT